VLDLLRNAQLVVLDSAQQSVQRSR